MAPNKSINVNVRPYDEGGAQPLAKSRWYRLHWPFLLLAAITLLVLLTNLGADYLWADEGDTAVLASNILKFGVPTAWDGVTFTDADQGARLNNHLVMVCHPWVQYYLAAGSFALLGQTTFAARLPFALAGWLTIWMVYLLVWQTVRDRRVAFTAASLLTLSAQFLLYSRQCRNYAPSMLVACVLLWSFLRMNSVRSCVAFAVIAILQFHTNPLAIVIVAACGCLTLFAPSFLPQRRWCLWATPAIAIFTIPWIALARRGYEENADLVHSVGQFFARFLQSLIECASVTPLIGALLLALLALFRSRGPRVARITSNKLTSEELRLLSVVGLTLLFCVVGTAIAEPSHTIWLVGVRYTPGVIPLVAIAAVILLPRGKGIVSWAAMMLLLGCTKVALLAPWLVGCDNQASLGENKSIAVHVPQHVIDSLLNTDEFYLLIDLFRTNTGALGETCEFLNTYARPADRVIANADQDPLYFHTRLPQALKLLPGYPIYETARRQGLPNYVFSVDGARWIVWRYFWDGFDGYRWTDVAKAITDDGGRLTQVATLKETIWENREDIHFRRFAGNRYLYSGFEDMPPGGIFRVDWDR